MGFISIVLFFGLLGALVGFISLSQPYRSEWQSYLGYVLPPMFISFFLVGLLALIFTNIESGKIYPDQDPIAMGCKPTEVTNPIISTTRETGVSGSFVLGTGGIHSVTKYYAYIKQKHGYKLFDFSVHNTYIVETDGEARHTRIDYTCDADFYNWMWYPLTKVKHNKGKFSQLYVPVDTILRHFEL